MSLHCSFSPHLSIYNMWISLHRVRYVTTDMKNSLFFEVVSLPASFIYKGIKDAENSLKGENETEF